jgi:hypothetical protein
MPNAPTEGVEVKVQFPILADAESRGFVAYGRDLTSKHSQSGPGSEAPEGEKVNWKDD